MPESKCRGGRGVEEFWRQAETDRMGKGANAVFGTTQVDAGLAARRGIDHRQEGGGDEPEVDATQVSTGHEGGEIGHGASTQPDDGAVPVVPRFIETAPQCMGMFNPLDLLTRLRQPEEICMGRQERGHHRQTVLLGVGVHDDREPVWPGAVNPIENQVEVRIQCGRGHADSDAENETSGLVSARLLDVVPPGFEPGTHGFSIHCSTT